jgi:hypothetical protein
MRYFATADSSDGDTVKVKSEGSGMTEVEEQILGKGTYHHAIPNRVKHVLTY